MYKLLLSKKTPELEDTAFAVSSLGDSFHESFCQSGKDFDSELAELGDECLLDRVDTDIGYQAAVSEWRARLVDALKSRAPVAAPS